MFFAVEMDSPSVFGVLPGQDEDAGSESARTLEGEGGVGVHGKIGDVENAARPLDMATHSVGDETGMIGEGELAPDTRDAEEDIRRLVFLDEPGEELCGAVTQVGAP